MISVERGRSTNHHIELQWDKIIEINAAYNLIRLGPLILLMLLVPRLRAQPTHPLFRPISIQNGLSQVTIQAIQQDSKGYMWFGTRYGLNKYDGYEFTTYHHDPIDSTSIDDNSIHSLFEDSKQRLWIGTNHSLNYFNRELSTFEHVIPDHPTLNNSEMGAIKRITEDKKGNLWLARTNMLQVFNPDTKSVESFLPRDKQGNYLGEIGDLLLDRKGRLWIGCVAGIRLFDPESQQFSNPLDHHSPPKVDNVEFAVRLLEDRSGNLWIGVRGTGLMKYEHHVQQWKQYRHINGAKNTLCSDFINDIIEDNEDNIWITSGRGGLNHFDPRTELFTHYSKHNSAQAKLNSNALNTLYQDHTGGIWIGTWHNGLNYLKENNPFLHYHKNTKKLSLSSNIVKAITEDKKGNLWVATDDGGGLNYIDRIHQKTTFYSLPISKDHMDHGEKNIKSMIKDRDGKLWLGTQNGLFSFAPQTAEWQYFRHDPNDENSLNKGFIKTLLQDYQGNIWIGTRVQGITKYDPKTQTFTRYAHDLAKYEGFKEISYLYEDSAGILWIGTDKNGLWRFNPKNEVPTLYEELVKKNPHVKLGINVIHEDHKKRLIVGTYGSGLQIINRQNNTIKIVSEEDGLSGNLVFGILEDGDKLWISTNKGISLYHHEKGVIRNLHQHDGLQANQFLPKSFYKTAAGELCFGGINGLSIFDPSQLSFDTTDLPLEITQFSLFKKTMPIGELGNPLKKSISTTDSITLNHRQSVFSFEFAALSYDDPQNNYYAYRLYPYEEQWQIGANRRYADYSNLPAGEYEFQVKASRSEHQWPSRYKTLQIKILPKPWFSWWAFTLYGLGVIGIFHLYRRFEMARIRTENALQQERFTHQKEEEVYQSKLQFFMNITHELRTPLTLMTSPLETLLSKSKDNTHVERTYKMILRNARKLQSLIDQLLDIRRVELGEVKLKAAKGDIVYFTKQISASFQSIAEKKKIDLSFQSKATTIDLWFDWDKMEKILNNLIANGIKYTPIEGQVIIAIHEDLMDDHVSITVADNGRGIAKDQLDKIFKRFYRVEHDTRETEFGFGIGLSYTKELVELHHGKIKVDAIENQGSTFSIHLPLGNGHLKKEERVQYSKAGELLSECTTLDSLISSLEQPTTEQKSSTILIVDDSKEIRTYLADFFRSDFTVLEACNGVEALYISKDKQPDVIISDVMMPKMDGIAFCHQLKSNLITSHIPIILLSALSAVRHRIKGIETGADRYIGKPFNIELLKAEVLNLIKSRAQLKQRFSATHKLSISSFSPSKKDEKFIREVIKVIDKHLDDAQFDKEGLLQKMHMSHSSMYRKLKSLTNLSVNGFIKRIRLNRAMTMLSDPDMNISQVAYKVGFTDPKYFSTCFKSAFGKNPSEFKLSLNTDQNISVNGEANPIDDLFSTHSFKIETSRKVQNKKQL